MHAFFALIIACLAVAAYGYPNPHIVGGKDAPIGGFPYQVSLRQYGRHSCGGSILNERTILTAAHCIVGYGSPSALKALTIHVGTNLLSETGTVYKAKQVIPHKDFNPSRLVNDIGLIILSTPIEYAEKVQPVVFASSTELAPAGSACVLSGWGRLRFGGTVPNKLQEITLSIYDHQQCKQKWSNVQPSHICTFTKAGEGACHGDSGGPLVIKGDKIGIVQVGIVSFGRPCAVGSPDVFTRVAAFKDWIDENKATE